MIAETDLTLRHMEDLKKIAEQAKDIEVACKSLGESMKVNSVYRRAAIEAYNQGVAHGEILAIELIPLQEKNDLKEMARKYATKETGLDYCRVLHLFINFMQKD